MENCPEAARGQKRVNGGLLKQELDVPNLTSKAGKVEQGFSFGVLLVDAESGVLQSSLEFFSGPVGEVEEGRL